MGQILVCVSEEGIRTLLLGPEREPLVQELADQVAPAKLSEDGEGLAAVLATIDRYWHDPHAQIVLPLDPVGTTFQHQVWKELERIPSGATISYGELARRLGQPRAARAVAKACGANPILLLIPCHRVVGSDGSLTGFRAGIEIKKWLLQKESSILS